MIAVLGLLKPIHRLCADEMSQVLIHESSSMDKSSSSSEDGQGKVQDKAKEKSIGKLVRSKQTIDRRFLNMTRVQQAKYRNFKIRFEGFSMEDEGQ